jgi:predicted phosphodiesterase
MSHNVRIGVISDTHMRHTEIETSSYDIVIHCGDACNGGTTDE